MAGMANVAEKDHAHDVTESTELLLRCLQGMLFWNT